MRRLDDSSTVATKNEDTDTNACRMGSFPQMLTALERAGRKILMTAGWEPLMFSNVCCNERLFPNLKAVLTQEPDDLERPIVASDGFDP